MIFTPGTKVTLKRPKFYRFFGRTMDYRDIGIVKSSLEADLLVEWYNEYIGEIHCSEVDEVEEPNEIIKTLI